MRGVPLLNGEAWWECPTCHAQAKTGPRLTPNMHNCPTLGGFTVPMVRVTNNHGLPRSAARLRLVEREDHVNGEQGLRYHQGRPIMAVRTDRADGSNDCAVFPGTAVAKVSMG